VEIFGRRTIPDNHADIKSGYHPWFSHLISLSPKVDKEDHYRSLLEPQTAEEAQTLKDLLPRLPDPRYIEDVISEVRQNLLEFPNAMLGEVGLDRSFRIAQDYFAYPKALTPFTVPITHQSAILEAQLDLAVELKRNVSLHSVKAQQNTLELLDKMAAKHSHRWNTISIDLHSCGLNPQVWSIVEVSLEKDHVFRLMLMNCSQKRHINTFLSLSTTINGRSKNHRQLIAACSPNRILAESDFNDINGCTERTWEIIQIIAEVKGWQLEEEWQDEIEDISAWGVVRRLEDNWRIFRAGCHGQP
jgi:Tat protein secretion system quality control protein TatD with DNase activity